MSLICDDKNENNAQLTLKWKETRKRYTKTHKIDVLKLKL